jgi:hypothetical protein
MKFYSCEWIVIPVSGFSKLSDLSVNLNCGLRKVGHVYLDADEVYKLQFAIKHQSQETINHFIESIPSEMHIKPWKPISEEIYLTGIDFSEFWNNLEPLQQNSWMDVVMRNGFLNQQKGEV